MPDRKIAIFAFRGEPLCFAHAVLHTLDLHRKGYEVKLILEGKATVEAMELVDPNRPHAHQYAEIKELGLVVAACKACSQHLGAAESMEAQEIPLEGEMSGHVSMSSWIEKGYEIITM
jgi:hypothetical protein